MYEECVHPANCVQLELALPLSLSKPKGGGLNPGGGGGGATISLNPPLTGGERGVERGVEPE